MRGGAIGDAFHLVLTEDVCLEDSAADQRDCGWRAVGRHYDRFLAPGPADCVVEPVLGLDIYLHPTASQILLDERLDPLLLGRVGFAARHGGDRVPEQFQGGRLARTTGADDTIEAVRQVQADTVEKSTDHGDRLQTMGVGQGGSAAGMGFGSLLGGVRS